MSVAAAIAWKSLHAGTYCLVVLRVGGALLALVIVGGCGSSTAGNSPEPAITRHLVYEKTVDEKGVWIADVDGGRPQLLVPDSQLPVISPDGKLVAYEVECYTSSSRDCDKAYVVSTVPGAKPRLLAQRIGSMTWSPDSGTIVATRSLSEDADALFRIDVATGEETTLARGGFWGWSVSPDGTRIVFAREQGEDSGSVAGVKIDLYVTDLDGRAGAKQITDTGDAWYPVWGPKSIAYAKQISCFGPDGGLRPVRQAARDGCFNNTWGRDEIWRIQPDGARGKPITGPLPKRFQMQGCVGLKPVDWSEDGQALLGAWSCEFSDAPVAINLETGKFRELAWAADTVDLSRDGRFALVHTDTGPETPPGKNSVLILRYPAGTPTLVVKGAIAPSWNR
jgi:WD40-like Beta Propeller Repeat